MVSERQIGVLGPGPRASGRRALERLRLPEPQVRKLVAQGFTIIASSPEALGKVTRDQLERYGKLFKAVGIKAD